MLPYSSELNAGDQNEIPSPVSWTTRLITLLLGALITTPTSRRGSRPLPELEWISFHNFEARIPLASGTIDVKGRFAGGGASMTLMAHSPPILSRTIQGEAAVPVKKLLKDPSYVPPRSQMVSPSHTIPLENAALRLHGLVMLPLPPPMVKHNIPPR